MKCTIAVRMNNAAFNEDDPVAGGSNWAAGAELARILREAAQRVEYGVTIGDALTLRDANGNTVGNLDIRP